MAGAAPGGQPQNYATQSLGDVNQAAMQARSSMYYNPQQVGASQIQMGSPFSPERISAQQIGSRDVNAERVAAERIAAGQLAQTSLDPYMNPFTQSVVDTTLGDLERQRQIQQQGTAAQAARAGAFGGSRQGVAESLTNEAFARQAAQTAAGLRQAGFTQAQQQAQQDLARQMQASQLNQATGLQASLANQATGLQAQTANQRAALEAARANQDAALRASLANQSTGLQAGLAGQQLGFEAQRANQATGLQAGLANQQAGLAGAQFRLGAGNQLAGIGQQRFGMGQTIENQIAQQGAMQRALQQQLIDAGRGQFQTAVGMPASTLGYVSSALGAAPVPQTTTQSRQPGVFDYLTLGASMMPSDKNLKEDIKKVGKLDNGVEIFTWKWNNVAEKLGLSGTSKGVIAQKVIKQFPDAVDDSGMFMMVNYAHPELQGALS